MRISSYYTLCHPEAKQGISLRLKRYLSTFDMTNRKTYHSFCQQLINTLDRQKYCAYVSDKLTF